MTFSLKIEQMQIFFSTLKLLNRSIFLFENSILNTLPEVASEKDRPKNIVSKVDTESNPNAHRIKKLSL